MKPLLFAGMVLVVYALARLPTVESSRFAGQVFEPAPEAMDFALNASDGTEFQLGLHRGQVVVLSFVYSFCPDVCPTTLVDLSQVRLLLGDRAKRVRFAFITLDPERDTPERFRTYVTAFDPTFLALTGSADQLARVRKAYGVVAEKQAVRGTSAAYLIAHSAYTYVIDPEGRLRLRFPFGMDIEAMAHDIAQLLRR
jgi:protein SCO1/2